MDKIREFLKSKDGEKLREYFIGQYNLLKNIENLKEYGNADEQVIELKAQRKAVGLIRGILEVILPVTEIVDNKPEDKYYNLPQ